MMPIDCSIVLHTEVLTAVYVKSGRMIWLMVITRTMDATQALFVCDLVSEAVVALKLWEHGRGLQNIQKTQQEDDGQRNLLTIFEFQMPDYWHSKCKDYEVYEQVRHSVPAEELVLIDASPSWCRLVPEV